MTKPESYTAATLADGFAQKILDRVTAVEAYSLSSGTEDSLELIKRGVEARNPGAVAEGYKTLKDRLESGAEDDSTRGVSMMNGAKKAAFQDLLTEAGVVYGFVYDDTSKRTVPARVVFEEY